MQIEFGGTRSNVTGQNVTGRKWAEMDDLEPIYVGKYRFWWKMICAFWAHYQLPFFWLCLFTQTWIQFFFFFAFFLAFFFFLLFLLRLSTFKPLNALYSKFERLKISGRTSAGMKSGVPGWRNPSQLGPPKFWTFKLLELDKNLE